MAARSRGLGISKEAMEASRLVFVYVRDSKPRRKVAIPVLDRYTWDQFCDQVKAKLKVSGIADIYLSANGHKVRSVSELQDIDELCVVEGPDVAMANGGSAFVASPATGQQSAAGLESVEQPAAAASMTSPTLRQQSLAQDRHRVVVSSDGLGSTMSASYATDEEAHKYARRAHPIKRTLQRLFPNLFAPGLPITSRDVQNDAADISRAASSRRRRNKRSPYDVKNLVLVLATMSCVFTMLYLFIRVSTSPAVASIQQAGAPGPGSAEATGAAGTVAEVQSAATAAAQQAARMAAGGTAAVAGGGGGTSVAGAPVRAGGVP